MYLDVFFFEIVRFFTMLSILSCTACGVIVALVSIQVQVHGPARVLLNKVDFNVVVEMVGVLKKVEVVDIVCDDKTVVVVVFNKALVVAVVGEDIIVVMVDALKVVETVE